MSSFLEIKPDKLNRIVGTPAAQTLVDVCCRQGRKLSPGVFDYRQSFELVPCRTRAHGLLSSGAATGKPGERPRHRTRFQRIFEELAAVGLAPEPAVVDEEIADDVLEQLLAVDVVLVWVNPLDNGKTRKILDPLLRKVAEAGRFVSAHPDVILKMGVKEVLYETRHIGWGVDTRLYRMPADLRRAFVPTLSGRRAARVEAEPRQRRTRYLEGRPGGSARRRCALN